MLTTGCRLVSNTRHISRSLRLCEDDHVFYTVRAQLGTCSDPFTVSGLARSLATTTANANGTGMSSTARPGAVIGSVAGFNLIATGAYLLHRRRKFKLALADKTAGEPLSYTQIQLFTRVTQDLFTRNTAQMSASCLSRSRQNFSRSMQLRSTTQKETSPNNIVAGKTYGYFCTHPKSKLNVFSTQSLPRNLQVV